MGMHGDTTSEGRSVRGGGTGAKWTIGCVGGSCIAPLILLVTAGAVFFWYGRSLIPDGAGVAEIEASYPEQVQSIREKAESFDGSNLIDPGTGFVRDDEGIFADPAIVEAGLWKSVKGGRQGFLIKTDEGRRGIGRCLVSMVPSLGEPIVNFWTGSRGDFVHYEGVALNHLGDEYGYTIVFDVRTMKRAP